MVRQQRRKSDKEPKPQNWRTPPHLFLGLQADAVERYGSPFTIDLACDASNCLCPTRPTSDAFVLPWGAFSVVWCNPPWNDISPWIAKAAMDGVRGAFLLPARTDRKWFQVLLRVAYVELFTARVAFIDPIAPDGEERTQPREGACVAWFGLGKTGMECNRFRNNETGVWE